VRVAKGLEVSNSSRVCERNGGRGGGSPEGILNFEARSGRTSYVVMSGLLGWYIFLLPSSSLPRRLGLGLCTIKEGKGNGKNESV